MDAKNLNNQEKLDHMFEMVTELNEEMHHLKRKESAENAFRLFYMAIIVGAMGGAYYFLSPFFNTIKKIPEIIDTTSQKVDQLRQAVPSVQSLGNTIPNIDSLKNQNITPDALKNIDPETLKKAEALLQEARAKASSTSK